MLAELTTSVRSPGRSTARYTSRSVRPSDRGEPWFYGTRTPGSGSSGGPGSRGTEAQRCVAERRRERRCR